MQICNSLYAMLPTSGEKKRGSNYSSRNTLGRICDIPCASLPINGEKRHGSNCLSRNPLIKICNILCAMLPVGIKKKRGSCFLSSKHSREREVIMIEFFGSMLIAYMFADVVYDVLFKKYTQFTEKRFMRLIMMGLVVSVFTLYSLIRLRYKIAAY
jgi:hypothetical protein